MIKDRLLEQFNYNGLAVSSEDRRHRDVVRFLRHRQHHNVTASTVAAAMATLFFTALLWSQSPRSGLIAFAVIGLSNSMFNWLYIAKRAPDETTLRLLNTALLTAGICWSTMAVLALPPTEGGQALVAALCIAVLFTGLTFAVHTGPGCVAWSLGLSLPTAASFAMLNTTIGYQLAVLFAVAALYSIVLGAVMRTADVAAAVLTVRNEHLVEELRDEKEQFARLATTDALTGSPNRLAFLQDLETHAGVTTNGALTMALIDLDHFKAVNDKMGHLAGDETLRIVARRITRSLGASERFYRLSGDELVVLQAADTTTPDLEDLGHRLLSSFADPLSIAGKAFAMNASVGIASTTRSGEIESLHHSADAALYLAKEEAGSSIRIFDDELRRAEEELSAEKSELAKAFADGKLEAWVQPIVDMHTGEIVSGEALLRWVRRDGVRPAAAFIDILEDAGLMAEADAFVVEEIAKLRSYVSHIVGGSFSIATNVSPEYLGALLDRFEIGGGLAGMTLELTEKGDIHGNDQLAALIERARAAGATVVIDDFGTGLSTMARLSLASVDGIKIDKGFVLSIDDHSTSSAIAGSIADIGRRMAIPVIAEGVETVEIAETLLSMGIRTGQGYLYSPAVAPAEFIRMMIEQATGGPYYRHIPAVSIIAEDTGNIGDNTIMAGVPVPYLRGFQ